MSFRRSLRQKLVYTFLIGSLLTVVLFSVVIKGIMNDYFRRESEARLQFIQEQSHREVRTNLAIVKDDFEKVYSSITRTLNALFESGIIGERLPKTQAERDELARLLREVQERAGLSLITIVDNNGRTVVRATNPGLHGDDTLFRNYENHLGPLSSIRRLIQLALDGKTIQSFEVFAPEILEKEIYLEQGHAVSTLKERAHIPLKASSIVEAPVGASEERGMVMTVVMPVRRPNGTIAGAVIAGRLVNKEMSLVKDLHNMLQDHISIHLGPVRAVTTWPIAAGPNKGENAAGTIIGADLADRIIGHGEYLLRESTIGGERLVSAFEPLRNHEGQIIGLIWLGRPLALVNSIARSQEQIESEVARRTNIYIVALAVVSIMLVVAIASIFSKRITAQIDQLRKGAEVIEEGNLTYRLRIESGDEIELLAKQFNSMAAKLEESYQTLEKKVEERTHELKASQEVMIQQEKMVGIGQLAAGIAHELNTPLGTIIGYAQMLREDLSAELPASISLDDVNEIIGQAGRCRDLVKNLLNFSRRSTTEKASADINAIIRKILSFVDHDFELKHVRIHTQLNPDLPQARVNENEIAQVVLNLANNAVDSMPGGGDLSIATTHDAQHDRIRIDVHDTGCGIKEADRHRVFEPFFTTKEIGKGTGLGLSICYKIVEDHWGAMEFDTVTGEGTTFRVYLPVNAEVHVG